MPNRNGRGPRVRSPRGTGRKNGRGLGSCVPVKKAKKVNK